MAFISLLVFLFLSVLCSSQSSSSVAGSTSSNAATVTVTSVSTLAIIILPSSSTQSSTTPYSYSSASSTSYVSSTLTSTPSLTSTSIALQKVPYTGQPMLVGTCNIPQFTALPFPDGSMLEVPLIGCSNDRPDCCPSLSFSNGIQPSATNVVSLLNLAPLDICPKDFIDIDPVCCPSGYSVYGQAIVGQTPCYTVLSTTISVPQTVLASISSAVAASVPVKSTTAAVSVIINQVFALSLPCADDSDDSDETGLSTAAKAGIGVGAGVGGLILLGLALGFCLLARKRRRRRRAEAPVASNTTGPQYGDVPNQMYENKQYPALPPGSPQLGYAVPPGPGSPTSPHQNYGPHLSWSSQTHTMPGQTSISSDGIHQYSALSPGSKPGYFSEMPAYQAQARSQMYEMPAK
jgi:hypothetical protein